ncbi:hypothetical protein DL1_08705 [Thioclava dalianensis]|uniref:Uncharacterized protein n=1 Tax=Thioclava dalianensis TaxID=1185766 RepID=A0A074U2G6_9RHOB|nr:hypothetical protein [Thioclava dalianensis]KEP68837.1 hypothetical protein DL1_08705 [Thioclava dalianensis]SFN49087.1 hypothetical protein SAMN05216224_10648 [Thioclava dalianensis]
MSRAENIRGRDLGRIERSLEIVAVLVGISPAYEPIFERLEIEHRRALAAKRVNPVVNAREAIALARAAKHQVKEGDK